MEYVDSKLDTFLPINMLTTLFFIYMLTLQSIHIYSGHISLLQLLKLDY